MAITLATGEALVGEGNEVAHIDLLIGSKSGPVGEAFAHAFVNESEGHTNLLAVVTPNLPAKPDTVISNKVTIKGARQAVQLFGPAQAAVSRAVVDSVAEGVIPKDQVDDLVMIVGVFIHWEAEDDKKIYDWNYEAVKMSIARAMGGEPSTSTRCWPTRPPRVTRSPAAPRGNGGRPRATDRADRRVATRRSAHRRHGSQLRDRESDRRRVRRRRGAGRHRLLPLLGGRASPGRPARRSGTPAPSGRPRHI